tara:strand:- start:16223 stop:16405 length:183 start_codon:yes stop_codon:yes gene_type:complete
MRANSICFKCRRDNSNWRDNVQSTKKYAYWLNNRKRKRRDTEKNAFVLVKSPDYFLVKTI